MATTIPPISSPLAPPNRLSTPPPTPIEFFTDAEAWNDSLDQTVFPSINTAITAMNTVAGEVETARDQAVTAKTGAETAQTGAQTAQTASETARDASVVAKTASETAQTASELAKTGAETAQTGAELAETNAKNSELNTDPNAQANRAGVISNTATTLDPLELATTPSIGAKPYLYTGLTGGLSVTLTGMALQDHNGVTGLITPAQSWSSVASYDAWNGTGTTNPSFAIDDSVDGNQKTFENITGVNTTTSPRLDTTNWKEADDQIGCELWIKNRDAVANHARMNSATGIGYSVDTSADSNPRDLDDTAHISLSTTNIYQVDISGTDARYNTNTVNYVIWAKQTTRKTAGYRVFSATAGLNVIQNSANNTGTDLLATTETGKFMIEHYNPTQGNSHGAFIGDGVAGHNIPHSLGRDPYVMQVKGLTVTGNIRVYNQYTGATKYLELNTTILETVHVTIWNDTNPTDNTFTIGSDAVINTLDRLTGFYLQANTDNMLTKVYQGTGVVGNVIDSEGLDMSVDGARIEFIKRLDVAKSWVTLDSIRSGGSIGVDDYLLLDTSAVEITSATFLTDFNESNITLQATEASYNASGGTYLIQMYSPVYNKPTNGKEIGFNSSIGLVGANGKNANNALQTKELTIASLASDDISALLPSQQYYAWFDAVTGARTYSLHKMNVGLNRKDADKWGEDTDSRKLTKTTDRHGDYESSTGVVSSSENYTTYYPYLAFDKITTVPNSWIAETNTASSITYTSSEYRTLLSFRIHHPSSSTRTPKRWKLVGSVDGVTWVDLFTDYVGADYIVSTYDWSSLFTSLDTSNKYKYFKVDITSSNDATYTEITEIELNFDIQDTAYLNTDDNIVYDKTTGSEVTKTLVEVGEFKTDGQGVPFDIVNYQANRTFASELVVSGVADLKGNTVLLTNRNSALPDLVTVNKRYILANPFGENVPVEVVAEIYHNGGWADVSFGYHASLGGMGTKASYVEGQGVVVRTGSYAIGTISSYTGGGIEGTIPATAPCRVRVTRKGGK
jgi:hypothetical protein